MSALLGLSRAIDWLNAQFGVVANWLVRGHGAARRALYPQDERARSRRSPLGDGIWIDIIGGFLLLLPICVILTYFTWPWFVESWAINEGSSNAGGLIRWPVKLMLPVGFALMALQGISEIITRIAAIEHLIDADFKYEKPLQ